MIWIILAEIPLAAYGLFCAIQRFSRWVDVRHYKKRIEGRL